MIELFNEDGHLTKEAFTALINDSPLGELERLEIAEHLSFCDLCVENYTALLTGETLLEPPEPVMPDVLSRLRDRARKVFINKYATAVAAASIAIVFWNVGIFNIDPSGGSKVLEALSQTSPAVTISERATEITASLSQAIQNLAKSITFERGNHQNEKK